MMKTRYFDNRPGGGSREIFAFPVKATIMPTLGSWFPTARKCMDFYDQRWTIRPEHLEKRYGLIRLILLL